MDEGNSTEKASGVLSNIDPTPRYLKKFKLYNLIYL